jgi:hypothetical protein
MKCPKCGYNSFEIHDTCKKCANDLTGYKNTHGLKSVVLPLEARTGMAEKLLAESSHDVQAVAADVPTDMFSFDVPDTAGSSPSPQDDPFNFGDEPATPALGGGEFSFGDDQKSAQAKAEEEAFASLLESSSQAPKPGAAAGAAAEDAGDDLSNFSWDDTPEAAPAGGAKSSDDFNDLFGDTDEDAKK